MTKITYGADGSSPDMNGRPASLVQGWQHRITRASVADSYRKMVNTMHKIVTVLSVLLLGLAPAQAQKKGAAGKDEKTTEYQKPVKLLIGAIRYQKDDMAIKLLALDVMTRELNTHHLAKMSDAQKKEFETGLGLLLRKLSFPKARELFQHIDAILYEDPKLSGDRATLKSTIVVHRAYKKQELVLVWTLVKKGKAWLILDVETVGESTLEGIREEQVDPLVKEGGVDLLMKKLREKLAEVGAR